MALAPHHPWVFRQASEVVFLALLDHQYFLKLVCVQSGGGHAHPAPPHPHAGAGAQPDPEKNPQQSHFLSQPKDDLPAPCLFQDWRTNQANVITLLFL